MIKCCAINGLIVVMEISIGFNGQLNNSKGVECGIYQQYLIDLIICLMSLIKDQ